VGGLVVLASIRMMRFFSEGIKEHAWLEETYIVFFM